MIVLDLESSGLDSGACGIWQIGAVDTMSGEEFIEEGRIDDEDTVQKEALIVIGKKESELRDKNKQSQRELIDNFLNWLNPLEEKIIAGHNIGFDIVFIQNKCIKYGLQEKFRRVCGFRTLDLHTLAQLEYKRKHGKFKTKEEKSDMHLTYILEICGIEDKRIQLSGGKVLKEGTPHNALEDARLTAKCFEKLLGGYDED